MSALGDRDADVIVVGAGAAGLAAARRLGTRGLHALVLEARERTGGRIVAQPAVPGGEPIELGAEYIHGPAPQTRSLLRAIGAQAVPTGEVSWASGPHGLAPADDVEPGDALLDDVRTLDADESVAAYLTRFAADPRRQREVRAARAFVEGFDAADPALAGIRGIAEEWHSGVDSTSARPSGGYAPLVAYLEARVRAAGARIMLGGAVTAIVRDAAGVRVDVRTADGAIRCFGGRAAIVTLPIGVLRAPDAPGFEPALPASVRAALARIEMGHAVRVGLQFRTPFWRELEGGRFADAAFFRSERRPFAVFWTQWPRTSSTIVAWAGGPDALALAGRAPAERIATALATFGALLGAPDATHDAFAGGVSSAWSEDRYARGAYSYLGVGAGDARRTLAEPIDDRLLFAGEATALDGQGGTVNGALVAGERAAATVAGLLAAYAPR